MPLSVLTAAELLQGISPRESELVSRLCVERRYSEGETIFFRGDPSDALYLLRAGRVKLCSVSEKGTEMILHILKPDAIFGELLFSEEERALTAVADTDVVVTAISRKHLEDLFASIPTVSRNFIRLLSRRLAKVETKFAEFGHTWSYHRLANVLLRLAEEHGTESGSGTIIALRLTHEDLAKLIGTTRETVTTQVARLRRMGLLKKEGRFYLVDRRKLSLYLESVQ
ncbi:MAG: Crp/Fnr family transcriptional regulator [Candidatus Deferrimicrobiaceae bacterium]